MTYEEAVETILEQFDRYNSNCDGCDKSIEVEEYEPGLFKNDICEDNGLICREKLICAAQELDND